MDLTEVKTILQIKTTNHDEYLATMIPLLIDWIKEYTNNTFEDINGQEFLPGGVRIFVAKACEHNMTKSNVSSRSMGEVSYTYELDFPTSLMRLIRPYKRLRFV